MQEDRPSSAETLGRAESVRSADAAHEFAAASDVNALVQAALDAAPCGMVLVDPTGRIVMANPAVTDILGYPLGTLVGGSVEMLLPERSRGAHVASRAQFLSAGHVRRLGTGRDLHAQHADGREIPVEIGLSHFRHGEFIYALASIVDITERQRLERQFLEAQKMEIVGRLAAGIAHDFNNLLTAILGYCELVVTDVSTNDPHRQDLEQIQAAAERATQLTRQLMTFCRAHVINPQQLDVSSVVKDIHSMLTRLLGGEIRIVLNLASHLPPITLDRIQLEQIVMNLAVNARDAMPHGGTLSITTARSDVDDMERPHVVLTVSDTGCGMTPDIQALLFEPFFTTKDIGKGTGLGLATVRDIVKGSGGTVTVKSAPGEGASFCVRLPTRSGREGTAESGS